MLLICSVPVWDQLNVNRSFATSFISDLPYGGTVFESLQLDKDGRRCFFRMSL